MAHAVQNDDRLKDVVRNFWERGSCGEVYARGDSPLEAAEAQARERYRLEPYIRDFARFAEGANRDVLEIGVGMGADHLEWAKEQPRSLTGIDLTHRAISHTTARLAAHGFSSDLRVADAEHLPFPDGSFDLVYSWGVIQHTTDTGQAAQEILRVLRPKGTARIMIYQTHSVVGYLIWLRYALIAGQPWRSVADVCADFLQGPGRKTYSINEARTMFSGFSRCEVQPQLSFGDLLLGAAGHRHQGLALALARRLWPRRLIRTALRKRGLYLLIEAVK